MDLIISLTTNKHNHHVQRLINDYEWDRIFVITTPLLKDKLKFAKTVFFIVVDNKKHIADYIKDLQQNIPKNIFGELAVNLVNGNGKDHMALLSALIKLGISFRLYGVTKNGVEEI